MLEHVSELFEGVRKFSFGFLDLLGNVHGDGHFADTHSDRQVPYMLDVEFFQFFVGVHMEVADQVLLVDGVRGVVVCGKGHFIH